MVSAWTQPAKHPKKKGKSVYANSFCSFTKDACTNHFVQRFLVNVNEVTLTRRCEEWHFQ